MYFFHAPSPGLLDGGVRHFVPDGPSSTGAARVSLPFIVCSLKMPLAAKALISVNLARETLSCKTKDRGSTERGPHAVSGRFSSSGDPALRGSAGLS